MKERTRPIAEILADRAVIEEALARAVREAVLKHAQAGFPVSACKGGKVVMIQPNEILARFGRKPNGETGP